MTITAGMTDEGFIAPTVDEIIQDTTADILAGVDAGLDLSPATPDGQIIAVLAEREQALWQLGATCFGAIDPGTAEGALLANDCALTGTYPQGATYSTVTCNLVIASGQSVAAGAIAWVDGQPGNTWRLLATVTNSSGTTETLPGAFQATTLGPNVSQANTLTQFSPSVGWISITNPTAAVVGYAADTDTTLRAKQRTQLAAEGTASCAAIAAAVSQVAGVIACTVFENTTAYSDAYGVPPYTLHVIVWDGISPAAANNDIAAAIWATRAGGTPTFGAAFGTVIDQNGASQTMRFDRTSQTLCYVTVNPPNGQTITSAQATAVQNAILTYFAGLTQGQTVVRSAIDSLVWALGIYTSSPAITLGTTASPVGTNDILIGQLYIASASGSSIVVTT